jgi:tyrosyl-tRNA synthetase
VRRPSYFTTACLNADRCTEQIAVPSFAEAAQRIIAGGGFYLNGDKVAPAAGASPGPTPELTEADLLEKKLAILQVGKGNHVLVEIE